jgi:hypothetical protein
MSQPLLFKYFCYLYFAMSLTIIPVISHAQTGGNNAFKQVRIDIGHMGLSCPNLEPQLEQKIRHVPGAQNLKVNTKGGYATFELPVQSTVTRDELRQMGIQLGYPANDVVVTFPDPVILKTDPKN